MANDRNELEELRRLDELERKSSGVSSPVSTGGGAVMVSPKMGASTPSTPETKERVSSFAEQAGQFLFGTPTREEFSLGELATTSGITGLAAAAGPKAIEYLGKGVSKLPTAPSKVVGGGLQALGQYLGKAPLARRTAVGTTAGAAGSATEQTGELMKMPGVVTLPASAVVSGAAGTITNVLGKALGLEGRSLAEMLRSSGTENASKILQKAGFTKSQAEQELAKAQGIERQLSQRELIATQRAEGKTPPLLPEESVRQAVLEKVNAEKIRARTAATEANLTADKANALIIDAEQGVIRATQALDNLEKQMLSRSNMSKEEFGKLVQQTTQQLYDDANKLRKTESNIASIIDQAGNYLKVPTSNIQTLINKQLVGIRNPALERILLETQNLATTLDKNGNPINALTVKSADSLKGYLDSIIHSKQFGDTKLDKETLNLVRDVKKQLMKNITDNYKPYAEAMAKFRTLSRPLDIVERNGALAKIIEKDPISLDYKMAEAAVTGQIISKANAGNKVFQRLLEKNEGLKDSARLYFIKELFGKEAAPTEAVMRTFLKNNERPLKQLGLFDEFRDLRVAKTTAQQAVNEAKEVEKVVATQAKGAKEIAKESEQKAKKLTDLSKKASTRLGDALKITDPIEEKLRIEKSLQKSAARAKPAEVQVRQQIDTAKKTINDQTIIERDYTAFVDDLKNMKRKDVPNAVKKLADTLYDKKVITLEERRFLMDEANRNLDLMADTNKARKVIAKMLGISAAVGVGMKIYDDKSNVISYR